MKCLWNKPEENISECYEALKIWPVAKKGGEGGILGQSPNVHYIPIQLLQSTTVLVTGIHACDGSMQINAPQQKNMLLYKNYKVATHQAHGKHVAVFRLPQLQLNQMTCFVWLTSTTISV